jgi:hypothetical protein
MQTRRLGTSGLEVENIAAASIEFTPTEWRISTQPLPRSRLQVTVIRGAKQTVLAGRVASAGRMTHQLESSVEGHSC